MLATFVRLALLAELVAWATLGTWIGSGRGWGLFGVAAVVLTGMLGIRLVLASVTFGLSWMWRSPRTPEQRLGAWGSLVLVAGEWLAMLANNFAWLPFERLILRADPPLRPDSRLPVILVHGYVSNRGTLFQLATALDRAGVGPVFVTTAPAVFAPIEAFASHLERVLEEVTTATGQAQAILVGHSMGGLIARCVLARTGAGRVRALITLGSPHHGSALALAGTGRNARQMRPGSEFLSDLARREGTDGPGCAALSLYTAHDNLVAPQASSQLAWARNVAIHGVGHLAMLGDARVHREVLGALAEAGASVPGR